VCIVVLLSIMFNFLNFVCSWDTRRWIKSKNTIRLVQLSAIRWCGITILWTSIVSFAVIILCVASQRVFVVIFAVVYFFMNSVRKFLDTPSYASMAWCSVKRKVTTLPLCLCHKKSGLWEYTFGDMKKYI